MSRRRRRRAWYGPLPLVWCSRPVGSRAVAADDAPPPVDYVQEREKDERTAAVKVDGLWQQHQGVLASLSSWGGCRPPRVVHHESSKGALRTCLMHGWRME